MRKKEFLGDILWVIGTIVVIILLKTFIVSSVMVSGKSMLPTLVNGEKIFALKTTKIDRFDIVTFKAPDAPKANYVKRVIGLPGDEISFVKDQLYINGEQVAEPYLDEYKQDLKEGEYLTEFQYTDENGEVKVLNEFSIEQILQAKKVPEGKYFVLGDNRQISKDSRYIGFIDKKAMLGEAKLVFWPLDRLGTIK